MTATARTRTVRRLLAGAALVVAAAAALAACASGQPAAGPTNDAGSSLAATITPTSESGFTQPTSPAGPGSTAGTTSAQEADPMLASLTGRTFYSTEVVGHDLVEGSRITVSFPTAGTLSANAGCNTMSGSWKATGEVLVVSTMAMTQMGCSPELMAQDTWLAQQFSKGVTVHLDGDTLTLTTVDGTIITLVDRKVVEPDLPLVGTTWTLESVTTGDAATSYADVTATMTIEGDRISFHACNSHSGDIEITGNTATTSKLLGTTMACPDDREQVERAMVSVLGGTFTFAIDGNHLTVTGEDDSGLTFTGISPTTGTGSGATSAPASPATPIVSSGPGGGQSGFPGSGATLTPVTSMTVGHHDSIPPQPSPNASSGSN
jgi:heat shock protein HslJ